MVFFGEYQVSFTGNGRLTLPKRIRELLKGETFILSKGFDKCLAGYDRSDWESRSQGLLDISLLDRENLDKRRFLFSSTTVAEVDEQGRFVIPKNLIDYAKLIGKKAVIAGVGDHFEIWEPVAWQSYLSQS